MAICFSRPVTTEKFSNGNWLRRGGRFRAMFEKTLERHGLPRDLFYVAMVESGTSAPFEVEM